MSATAQDVERFAPAGATDADFTASDGVRIHYLTLGEAGSPVVLIHGFGSDADYKWFSTGVAQRLAEKHRVVAIDCRGHGASEKPADPMKYGPRMAADVIELMDRLGIERAHIHGYSMGGFILTQLLSAHPERFLTAAWGGSGVRETDPARIAELPADEEGEDPAAEEATRRLRSRPGRDERALEAVRAFPWPEDARTAIDLAKVRVPALAINGSLDKPHEKTHRLARELRNFTNVILPGLSHNTAVTKDYIDALEGFLDAHDAA